MLASSFSSAPFFSQVTSFPSLLSNSDRICAQLYLANNNRAAGSSPISKKEPRGSVFSTGSAALTCYEHKKFERSAVHSLMSENVPASPSAMAMKHIENRALQTRDSLLYAAR